MFFFVFNQAHSLATRAYKQDVLLSFEPKFMLKFLILFVFLLFVLFFLGFIVFNHAKIRVLFQICDHTILAINVLTWVLFLNDIDAGNCFTTVKNVLHATVTLSLFPNQKLVETVSVDSYELLFFVQNFANNSDAINSVTNFH